MSNSYSALNAQWRERLAAAIKKLSDSDLGKPAGGPGWTIGGLLAHLAFYDHRVLCLLDKWKNSAVGPSLSDTDVMNDAMKPLFNGVAHHEIRRLVLEAAEAVDAAIDALDPVFLARVEKDGPAVKLNRGLHREHHLKQIESAR
jgi:uncharacterized damage-inducible protein DinB